MSANIIIYSPKFPAEIVIARRNAMTIYNTKIDDMGLSMNCGSPKFTREEKLKHYCEKLQLVWEKRICFE